MGRLGNIFNRGSNAQVPTGADPYVPADLPGTGTRLDRLAAGGNAMLDKATQVYKQHPKLIGGLAVVAGAAILAGMKRRGR